MNLTLLANSSCLRLHFPFISTHTQPRRTIHGVYASSDKSLSKQTLPLLPIRDTTLFKVTAFSTAFTAATLIVAHTADAASTDKLMEVPASLFTLADGGIGDWFGGLLYSAGQQANEAVQDQLSALSFTRALQRSSLMDVTLSKAHCVYPDCNAMVKKLCAMTYNDEELVLAQKKETNFLVQLVGRTTPKGLHCLSMRLTAEYFALEPENIKILSQKDLHDADSYHFAVFSDNVLACSVVVQSTIATAREPERIIFHIVTDSLNFPAISMWFLLYPPGKATIDIQSIDKFKWLSNNIDITKQKEDSPDTRYTSALNHLRFYLPDMFPKLDKIVLLDHDVIVQRDLTELWNIEMMGKTNGAVETCQVDDPSYRSMDMFINFSDPLVASKFDVDACTWAFGMNIFDLQEWRRRKLTRDYEDYLLLGKQRPLWKAGSLPLGWITFYNNTVRLDRKWHVLGLGYQSGVKQPDIDQAAVIHYDGIMKPWLDVGLEKYKHYWRRQINYSLPFLQQCNIQQ